MTNFLFFSCFDQTCNYKGEEGLCFDLTAILPPPEVFWIVIYFIIFKTWYHQL